MAIGNPLQNLFGKSPIKPLQEHMTAVVECAEALQDFLAAAIADDWPAAEEVYNRIYTTERHADELKKQLRLHMPSGLFMPVSRTDLLELLSVQDHIANRAKDIAGLMLGRQMRVPEALQGAVSEFLAASISATQQALKAINELDELLETGFTGSEVTFVEELIEHLAELENRTDILERDIRHRLFKLEGELAPVETVFLYQIIDSIGELADLAERVGGRLQLLLAR